MEIVYKNIDDIKPYAGNPLEWIKAILGVNAERVIDYFGGSGTTLIACEIIGAQCYMIEKKTKYCDAIIDRWETLTGERAEYAI